MKHSMLALFFIIMSPLATAVDSFYCFHDERIHEKAQINPRYLEQGCRDIVKNDPNLLKVSSASGKIKIEAIDDLFYVINGDTIRLMYGPQTKLSKIGFIKIDEETKNIFVIQRNGDKSSLSMFNAEAVGNVTPRLLLESKTFAHIGQIEHLRETKELALISQANKSIAFINDDADSRLEKENENFKVKVKRFINGPKSLLMSPTLVTATNESKKIYVYDSARVLVFEADMKGNMAPLKVYAVSGKEKAIGLRYNDEDKTLDFLHPKEKISPLKLD
jgi:hypothetical protein